MPAASLTLLTTCYTTQRIMQVISPRPGAKTNVAILINAPSGHIVQLLLARLCALSTVAKLSLNL